MYYNSIDRSSRLSDMTCRIKKNRVRYTYFTPREWWKKKGRLRREVIFFLIKNDLVGEDEHLTRSDSKKVAQE